MTYQEAITLGTLLIQQHGLDKNGWRMECINTRAITARCDHRKKRIQLSINFLYREEFKIKNSILHEIAHAICGYQHGHSLVWQQVAQKIGCNGERCALL